MWKKRIIIISIIVIVVGMIAGIILSQNSHIVHDSDNLKTIKGDVVMSTKVSRPGCEKTDSCYTPSKIVIKQDNSVTWVNEDAAFHSVTSGHYGEPSGLFDSGYLDPEESFTFIFETAGTYDYFCTLHPWMKGQVIVE
ncbi:MAG TPA: plastocyanin/azurin family copper-binding protein [Nitrosarchaeum sp.]|nr:plastocyanin/azurin family copper-binding protein [Nitrosarchaeum sp.]